MIYCDRAAFMAAAHGILLDRDAAGRVAVYDTPEIQQAVEAALNGEAVTLTVDGKSFSRLITTSNHTEEVPIGSWPL